MSYSKTNTARYIYGSMLMLGILNSLSEVTSLIALLLKNGYSFGTLFYTIITAYKLIFLITIMVLMIIKSNHFFKTWVYTYGIYLGLLFINLLTPSASMYIDIAVYMLIGNLFSYIFWIVIMIVSKSFDNKTYGIPEERLKRFLRNIWS